MRAALVDNWTWQFVEPFDLSPWFDNYHLHEAQNQVKANANRVVFKIQLADGWYYVKHDRPSSLGQKLRSFCRSKAESEFSSAMVLEAAGIPVVKMVAWGRRGSESMLVSKELANAKDAHLRWLGGAQNVSSQKELFLKGLANFIRLFVAAGAHHPDLHLGNLLIVETPNTMKFHLVDPYGADVGNSSHNPKKSGVWTLAGAMRGTLDFAAATSFLISAGIAKEPKSALDTWRKIISHEARDNRRQWARRKARILAGRSRYCKKIACEGQTRYLRCSFDGTAFVPLKHMDNYFADNELYNVTGLSDADAEILWTRSFMLQYNLINHCRPVAWIRSTRDSIMAFETFPAAALAPVATKDFLERCALSGVRIHDPTRTVIMVDGAPYISDIRQVSLS